MRRRYNSEKRDLQLHSKIVRIELASFMHEYHITDRASGLSKLIDRINALVLQLPIKFGDDNHKNG